MQMATAHVTPVRGSFRKRRCALLTRGFTQCMAYSSLLYKCIQHMYITYINTYHKYTPYTCIPLIYSYQMHTYLTEGSHMGD